MVFQLFFTKPLCVPMLALWAFQQQGYVIYHKYDHKLNWYVINIHVFAFKDLLFWVCVQFCCHLRPTKLSVTSHSRHCLSNHRQLECLESRFGLTTKKHQSSTSMAFLVEINRCLMIYLVRVSNAKCISCHVVVRLNKLATPEYVYNGGWL